MVGMGGALLALQTAIRCSQSVVQSEYRRHKAEEIASSPAAGTSYSTPGFNARLEPINTAGYLSPINCSNTSVYCDQFNSGVQIYTNCVNSGYPIMSNMQIQI